MTSTSKSRLRFSNTYISLPCIIILEKLSKDLSLVKRFTMILINIWTVILGQGLRATRRCGATLFTFNISLYRICWWVLPFFLPLTYWLGHQWRPTTSLEYMPDMANRDWLPSLLFLQVRINNLKGVFLLVNRTISCRSFPHLYLFNIFTKDHIWIIMK